MPSSSCLPPLPPWMTYDQLAMRLCVSKRHLYREVRSGRLRPTPNGRRRLFSGEEVGRYEAALKAAPVPPSPGDLQS